MTHRTTIQTAIPAEPVMLNDRRPQKRSMPTTVMKEARKSSVALQPARSRAVPGLYRVCVMKISARYCYVSLEDRVCRWVVLPAGTN